MGVIPLSSPDHVTNMFKFLVVAVFLTVVSCDENFSGEGELACYGDQEILLDKVTGTGMINCQPSWGSAAAPPQGIIADGADGSHWVTVDDKGYGTCVGDIYYKYGDLGLGYCNRFDDGHQTRLLCAYSICTGHITVHCSMLSGCHGADQ